MGLRHSRRIVFGVAGLVVGILTVACIGYREALVDAWYIFQVGSEDLVVSEPAAAILIERGSTRAIPALVRKVAALPAGFPGDQGERLRAFRQTLVSGIQSILTREPYRAYAALPGTLKTGVFLDAGLIMEILYPLRGEAQNAELITWLEGDSKAAFLVACYTLYAGGPAAIPFLERAASSAASPRVRRNAEDLLQALREGEELSSPAGWPAASSRQEQAVEAKSSRGVPLFEGEYDGVFLCGDKSGSMNEAGKFQRMRAEMLRVIDALEEGAQFGITFFDTSMSAFPWKSRRPARATPAWKAAGQGFILATSPGHASCLLPALRRCLEVAANSTARSKCILFFSDGTYTCSGWDPEVYAREVLQVLARENHGKVPLHTVFFGNPGGPGEAWMRDLAGGNGGSCRSIGH